MLATFSGTVESGTDATNVFGLGSALGALDDAVFTARFQYDTSLGTRTTGPHSDRVVGGPFWGGTSAITYSAITINGVTETFDVSQNGSANVFDQTTMFGRYAQTFLYSQFNQSTSTVVEQDFLQLFVFNAPTPLNLETPFTGGNIPVTTPPLVMNQVSKYHRDHGLLLADYQAILDPNAVNLRAIPEPATWLMLISGFAAIGVALRRSRRLSLAS